MALNQLDAADAYLEGHAAFEEWRKEFEAAFYEPVRRMMGAMLLASLPEPVKRELQRMSPEAYAEAEAEYGSQISR